jgi:SSS family solute:Na+ symporter
MDKRRIPDYAFLDRMSIVFVILLALIIIISLLDKKGQAHHRALVIDTRMFRVSTSFIIGSVVIIGILTALYTVFW